MDKCEPTEADYAWQAASEAADEIRTLRAYITYLVKVLNGGRFGPIALTEKEWEMGGRPNG